MKMLNSKKLMAGSLALALVLGGAIYAYADEAAGTNQPGASASVQDQKTDGKQAGHKDEARKKARFEESFQQLATILGMTKEEIKTQLKSGKSIADLAKEKGIAEQTVIDKLVANASQKIDKAVKAGKITKEKGDQIKQNLPVRIKKLVEHKGLMKHGDYKHRAFAPNMEKIAGWLGMSKEDLKKELGSGKSLADIAAQHGKTKDQLVSKIQEEMKPNIERFVTRSWKKDQNEK